MSDLMHEISEKRRTLQTRPVYLLLSVAAGGILLSVIQMTGSKIAHDGAMLPLFLAMLSWSFSFFAGYRLLTFIELVLLANMELLQLQKGKHPDVGNDEGKIIAASKVIQNNLESYNITTTKLAKQQSRFVVLGVVMFFVWLFFSVWYATANIPRRY